MQGRNYVITIHSETEVPKREWQNEPYVKADITVLFKGIFRNEIKMLPRSEWEYIKAVGYYNEQ